MATLDEIRLQQLLAPFNRTGVLSSSQAVPMINNIPMINTGAIDQSLQNNDLVEQIIAENQRKISQFDPRNFQSIFSPTGIKQPIPLDMNRFQGVSDMSIIDETTNDEQDQEYIDQVNENNQSGIMKVLRSIPTPTNLLLNMLPKPDPRETNIRNFYGNRYGLTSAGSLASGIMAGYNPVFGSNFLNKLTGGRLPARSFGLAEAARKRIERIANRKRAQTDASRAKIAALQKFAREDTTRRARFDNPNVYAKADKLGFTGPGGGFKSAGTNENFSNKTGRGRTGY